LAWDEEHQRGGRLGFGGRGLIHAEDLGYGRILV
jgi:hypothetical protein